jgi:DivIVA domain-containing protein
MGKNNARPSEWGSVRLNADLIRASTFETVRRGYDPELVTSYLERVADHVEALESELNRLTHEFCERDRSHDKAAVDESSYGAVSARVADLIRTFEADVEEQGQKAEAEASRIVEEAKAQANGVLREAQAKADEIHGRTERKLREAQGRAERALSELTSRRGALVDELGTIRQGLFDAIATLDGVIEAEPPSDVVVVEGSAQG